MLLKKLLKTNALVIITLLLSFSAFAQAPNLLNYQGVARNAVGNPLPNQTMKLRLSIHDLLPSGAVVYSEIRQITTNLGGLFSVQIGSAGASSSTGTLGGVNWIVGNKFLQVELDPASNNNYMDIGTVQLVSVPYAFGAGSAATVKTNANLTGVVTSVGNQTSIANGAITSDMIGTLTKSKVGLDLVNNTSDAAKPISTATQAALGNKLNIADSTTGYVTPAQLAAKTFDQTPITNAIAVKLAIADSTTGYVTPAQLAAKTFDQTPITNAIAGKLAIADSTIGYVTPTQLAAKTFDTTSISSRINLKANTTSVNTALALKANIASPIFTGTVTTGIINTGALSSTSITASTYASVPKTLSYSGTTINWDPAQGLNAAITLTQNSSLSFTAAPPVGSYGTIVLAQDGTGSRTITLPTLGSVTNKVLGSTSTSTVALSTAANSKDILNFYFDGTNCYWNVEQGYGTASSVSNSGNTNLASAVTGTLAVANGGTGATTATAALTNLGAAPLASPTFTGTVTTDVINSGALSATSVNTGTITATSINSPIYASTPQVLTAGSTINWNPALGLNASVTLNQNTTINFSSNPTPGAYGTLVVTQGTGGNFTLTLPSTANKVLGSTSTTAIALSTAAGAKDIINFYFDGTNCYWNVGQGYGTAAAVSSTNLASSVSGTLPVANGGTGATTLTGLIKGNGTSTMTAATAGTDYLAGTSSLTTGILKSTTSTGALTIATASDFPTLNQNTTGNAATATLATTATSATNATTAGNITATSNTTLTSLSNLSTVGNITSGTISLSTNITTSSKITAGTVTYPNVHGTANQVLTTTGSGTLTWTTPASSGGDTYTIGLNNNLGGYVVYVTPDGKHGLVAETVDQVRNTQTTASGFASREIFRLSYLATDPRNHSTAGKNFMDWRIPNYWEMQQVILYKTQIGGFDGTNWPNYFLSISINRNETDWIVSINGGDFTGQASNGSTVAVRTVRSF